ncbi:MAG: hypothetical protein KBA08_02375 [Firmicutes bacterium]|nr:hypothetical protein [Bacillota bacterium]
MVIIMSDKKIKTIPLDDELLANIGGGTGAGNDCCLQEGEFPRPGKCFNESGSMSGRVLQPACPYCRTWTSLPEGANLVVAHIFECTLYGYVKRDTE